MANCETFPSKQGTQKYDNVRIELKVKLKKLIFSSRKSIYELVEVGNLGEELCKYIRWTSHAELCNVHYIVH